jgi:pimeloyl-ACP methyl ester carboxylesterase
MGLAALVCTVAALLAVVAGALWMAAVKAQTPRRVPNTEKPPVPFEEVEWSSGDAVIRGWWMEAARPVAPSPEAARPAVVVAHGWGSNRTRMLRYAVPLHAAGYSVLVYDARGHGESDPIRVANGLQFRDDLISALEWLRRQPGVDRGRIGVLGHSLGGFAGVLALEENAPIAALVTDAMPVRFETMVEAELRRRKLPKHPLKWLIMRIFALRMRVPWETIQRTDPVRVLVENRAGRRVPALHVHSVRDGFIPHAELLLILDGVPDAAHLLVDTEGHSSSDQDPRFWPTVLAFYREHLGQTGVSPALSQGRLPGSSPELSLERSKELLS